MHSRLSRLLAGAAAVALSVGFLVSVPTANAIGRPDVLMHDNGSDTGAEPSTGSIWSSPDIRVCSGPMYCAADDPVTPGQLSFVFVTLTNTGQAPTDGRLYLYYTESGGNAQWPSQWTAINNPTTDLPLAPGVNPPLMIPWLVPEDYAHFCLLARWWGLTDPLPLIEGPSTVDNTRASNNIAWHNVSTSPPLGGKDHFKAPFMIGNPNPRDDRAGLVIFPEDKPFIGPGDLVIDLGPELFSRWKAAGGAGEGVKQVGETQLRVVDPKRASLKGITLRSKERFSIGLDFAGGEAAAGGRFAVNVVQTNVQGQDQGGVQYRLNFK